MDSSLPSSSYEQHSFSEDGTLFFGSDDALVPHDSNGREDVYEYKDGHVYSISDVTGGYDRSFSMSIRRAKMCSSRPRISLSGRIVGTIGSLCTMRVLTAGSHRRCR